MPSLLSRGAAAPSPDDGEFDEVCGIQDSPHGADLEVPRGFEDHPWGHAVDHHTAGVEGDFPVGNLHGEVHSDRLPCGEVPCKLDDSGPYFSRVIFESGSTDLNSKQASCLSLLNAWTTRQAVRALSLMSRFELDLEAHT